MAFGAQTTRLSFPGMFVAGFPDQALDVQFLSEASIEFPKTDFNRGPQLRKRVNTLKQLAPKLLLRRFR